MDRKHDVKFFVYIIESPSADNFYDGISERDMIAKAVSLNNIPCSLKVAVTEGTFSKALTVGLYEEMAKHSNFFPIIHLSTHGSGEGIQLTDGTIISWAALREYFKPINKALGGTLLLCMSSCRGYNACRMSMNPKDPDFPFWAVIGPSDEPLWSQTAVAYATFYHQLAMGQYITDAIKAMQAASGNQHFFMITAREAHESFIEILNKQDTQEARTSLGEAIEEKNPEHTGEIEAIKRRIDT